MPSHEQYSENLFDFRTGRPTAISSSSTSESQRAACTTLNRERTSGILEAAQNHAPGESLSVDAWTEVFERALTDWDTPLIPLSDLGLSHDVDGFVNSEFLEALPSGAEAEPYLDREHEVVYKLFNLKINGALGRKLSLEREEDEGEFQVELKDADLRHTLTKLSVLNQAGAHPTEIVGLADTGDYLIAKQPLAYPLVDFAEDQKIAIQNMRGIVPRQGGFRQGVTIIWVEQRPWLVGDLHNRNIMRDFLNRPCIIDALIGPITPAALQSISWLKDAVSDAEKFRRTGIKPRYDLFDEIDDAEL